MGYDNRLEEVVGVVALTPVTDESLMAAHLRGDEAAFRELVERYADGVLRYLIHMTANRDQAEDLFQETFKKVHEKAHTYRGPVFKSWLFTIATRATIDHLRRRRRVAMLSLDQEADCGQESSTSLAETLASEEAPDPAEELVREERKQQVREAVASLPVKQRAALVLAYYQQLSYREVADVMGCSLGTVKTQMSRALATLARKLPDSISVTK
jgi:RNA polymerase sigma-70 factor (ECF subfamily)